MKKIAIVLSIMFFAQMAAFAGGTVLYTQSGETVQAPEQEVPVSDKGKRKGKLRIGTQKNDPNTYWNFGRVNFGSGLSSEGSSTRRF